MRKQLAALAAAVMIGSLAACGGGTGGASGDGVANIDGTAPDATTDGTTATTVDAPTDPEEAALAFTKCMRDHGVDMPDPQKAQSSSGGAKGPGVVIAVQGNPEDPSFQKAQEACEPLMANARSELDNDPARQAEMKRQMLDFAACMRDHGVDMADPQFDADGRVKMDAPAPTERDSKAFQDASKACSVDGGPGFTVQAGPAVGSSSDGPSTDSKDG